MPIRVQAPDGSIAEFPDGMPDDQITAVMAREYGKPKPESFSVGVLKGQTDTLRNVGNGLPFHDLPLSTGSLFNKLADINDKAIAASGRSPSKKGQFTGSLIESSPLAFVPGGPAVGGAAQGYLTSDAQDLPGRLVDAGIGAIGGKIGGAVVDKAAGLLGRGILPEARSLGAEGVKLSPGQARGGKALIREDKNASRPFVGTSIAQRRAASVETWNRARVNEALAPLNIKLPDHIPTGHEAVGFLQDQVSQAYDAVVPKLSVRPDKRFAAKIMGMAEDVKILPDQHAGQLQKVLGSIGFDDTGALAGRQLRAAQERLGTLARDFGRSADPNDRLMGKLFGDAKAAIDDLMVRQNPKYAPVLQAANKAFRGELVIDNAAGRTADGVFTPRGFNQAVKAVDSSRRKKSFAAGKAMGQDAAKRAMAVLPSRVPNSGTADRLLAGNPVSQVTGLLADVGQRANQAATDFLLSPQGAALEPVANWLGKLTRPAASAGSTSAVRSHQR